MAPEGIGEADIMAAEAPSVVGWWEMEESEGEWENTPDEWIINHGEVVGDGEEASTASVCVLAGCQQCEEAVKAMNVGGVEKEEEGPAGCSGREKGVVRGGAPDEGRRVSVEGPWRGFV